MTRNLAFVGLLTCALCSTRAYCQGKKSAGTANSGAQGAAPSAPSPSSAAFESQMIAFGSLDLIAANIAKSVCKADGMSTTPSIVIFDQASMATLQSYQAFLANARAIVGAYESLIEDKSVFSTLKSSYQARAQSNDKKEQVVWIDKMHEFSATGPAFGDPISDATSLLSAIAISANTESPGQITIPDSAMAVALTRTLSTTAGCKGKQIIYPPLFGAGSTTDISSVDVQADIQEVDDVRTLAHNDVSRRNTLYIAAHPAAPATPAVIAKDGTVTTPAKSATPGTGDTVLTGALTDVNGLYDSFMNSLLQVNSSTGLVGTAAVVQGRQLATLIAGNKTSLLEEPAEPAYVLLASILAAGGTTHQHKTFWTALTIGDRFTYSGGAVVNVALWKVGAKAPAYADIIRYRSPLMKLKKPSDLTNVNSGDNFKQ